MKNKLYNLINGGLLSLSAILVGMTLMVAGCSNPGTVAGGDLNEAEDSSSSTVESSDSRQSELDPESSSDGQIGYPGLCLEDPEASGCEVAKPDEKSSSSTVKSSDSRHSGLDPESSSSSVALPRLVTTSSSMEQVESSSSVTEQSSSDEKNEKLGLCLEDPEASGCEIAKPDEKSSSSTVKSSDSRHSGLDPESSSSSVALPRLVTTSSSMEQVESSSSVTEQSSDSNGDKKISKLAGSDPNCEASYTREWKDICDTLHNYILFEKTLETLDEDRYVNVYRWEDKYSVEQFSMPNAEFRAKYRSDEPWLQNLVDEGIVWDGGEWDEKDDRSGLNVHYEVRPDTVLHAYRDGRIYMRVAYGVRYYIETEPNVEHRFEFDIPVRYRYKEFFED